MSDEPRVWIAQCLCGPARHCILAASGKADGDDARSLVTALRDQVTRLLSSTLNPWCGICRAPVSGWYYELGRTRFATMAEALPYLCEAAASQRSTAAVLGRKLH